MGASGPRDIKCPRCGEWKEKLSMTFCKACDKKVDAKRWEQDGLIKEMVTKLNAASVGGPLAPWFAIWRDRAEKALAGIEEVRSGMVWRDCIGGPMDGQRIHIEADQQVYLYGDERGHLKGEYLLDDDTGKMEHVADSRAPGGRET